MNIGAIISVIVGMIGILLLFLYYATDKTIDDDPEQEIFINDYNRRKKR